MTPFSITHRFASQSTQSAAKVQNNGQTDCLARMLVCRKILHSLHAGPAARRCALAAQPSLHLACDCRGLPPHHRSATLARDPTPPHPIPHHPHPEHTLTLLPAGALGAACSPSCVTWRRAAGRWRPSCSAAQRSGVTSCSSEGCVMARPALPGGWQAAPTVLSSTERRGVYATLLGRLAGHLVCMAVAFGKRQVCATLFCGLTACTPAVSCVV